MRRALMIFALAVPITVSSAGSAPAWAGSHPQEPAGVCAPHHLSGCDGTDSPDWRGKHGRALQYCGPDGKCGPVNAEAARRDTELYGDPVHRGPRPR
jgi:hypothetical protein